MLKHSTTAGFPFAQGYKFTPLGAAHYLAAQLYMPQFMFAALASEVKLQNPFLSSFLQWPVHFSSPSTMRLREFMPGR
jgi:hypothetical protein